MLKVSVKSVRLWIAEGQIRAVRLPGGRRLRIPVEEAYRLMGKGEPEEVPAR
jgi:excisionase family DNA binding protein